MIDDAGEEAEQRAVKKEPLVTFTGAVSLGNVLILLGMVGTGMVGIYTVGGQLRGVQDAIAHETDLRLQAQGSLADKVADYQRQEARDISTINQSIMVIHDDIRTLVAATSGAAAAASHR